MYNDLTFFTNQEGHSLLERFNKILKNNTQYFDILVGYFRSSGFYNLYEAMEGIEKIRILVGINVDKKTIDLIDESKSYQIELKIPKKELIEDVVKSIDDEFEKSDDSEEVELGAEIKAISDFAFNCCKSLKRISINGIVKRKAIKGKNNNAVFMFSIYTMLPSPNKLILQH